LSRRWWRFMSESYVSDAEGGSGGSDVAWARSMSPTPFFLHCFPEGFQSCW
jgi:hypothetical protein